MFPVILNGTEYELDGNSVVIEKKHQAGFRLMCKDYVHANWTFGHISKTTDLLDPYCKSILSIRLIRTVCASISSV